MKKLLTGLLTLVSLSSFATEVVVDCIKSKGDFSYRVILSEEADSGTQTVSIYKNLMSSDESVEVLSKTAYFMSSPTSSMLAYVVDSETHGENFELKLKKNRKTGFNQAPFVGKLESSLINLKRMDCSVY